MRVLMRLAEDMRRIALSSSPFYEDPWRLYRMIPTSSWPEFRQLEQQENTIPKIGKNGYQVSVDVTDFKPSELTVKVVDNSVVVEGNHEERQDEGGYVARKFVRRYELPQGFDPAQVMSTLSSDGLLTVTVPNPKTIENNTNERLIQIQQTGPAHLNVKENANSSEGNTQSSSSTSGENQSSKSKL